MRLHKDWKTRTDGVTTMRKFGKFEIFHSVSEVTIAMREKIEMFDFVFDFLIQLLTRTKVETLSIQIKKYLFQCK